MSANTMRIGLGVAALMLLGGTLGCSESHGALPDSGMGEACGPALCARGEVCCNASCGICTGPGEGCPAIECVDAGPPATCGGSVCSADQLCCPSCPGSPDFCVSGGVCPAFDCPVPPPGCESCGPSELCCPGCPGFDSYCASECDGGSCPPLPECDDDRACPVGFYCDRGERCSGPGSCAPTPDACDADCPGVCGCDGVDYCNACNAAHAGVNVAHPGTCAAPSCEGRSYCSCVDAPGCAPLIDLSTGCVCPCDDPFNCTGELCDCACGGAEYRGCVLAERCSETELRCEGGCQALRGSDGCLTCVCASAD